MLITFSLFQLEIFTILLWISLWGLIDNLVNKYSAPDDCDSRILIFTFITSISLLGIIFR